MVTPLPPPSGYPPGSPLWQRVWTVQLLVAGPVPRALAYAMDLMIRMGVYYFAAIGFGLLAVASTGLQTGFMLLFFFLMEWFYNLFFEQSKSGATPGQRMFGLRVVSENGSSPTFGQSFVRNLLRTADFLPLGYGLGAVVCLSTKRFQRIGDLAARTLVIHTTNTDGMNVRRVVLPRAAATAPPPPEPPTAPLLPDEVRALTEFDTRLTSWAPARQVELATHAEGLIGTRQGQEAVRTLRGLVAWFNRSREGKL